MDDIIRIHDLRVDRANKKSPESTESGTLFSGTGQLDNLIDRISSFPLSTSNPHRDIVKVISRLYEGISRRHPFVDCNKRTAILVAFETCLMNRYYLQKKNTKTEVDFAKKVASTTIEEFGYDEIAAYFEERIVPYVKFAAMRLGNEIVICPFCRSPHKVLPGICKCGKRLTRLRIIHHGELDDYIFDFSIRELLLVSRFRSKPGR